MEQEVGEMKLLGKDLEYDDHAVTPRGLSQVLLTMRHFDIDGAADMLDSIRSRGQPKSTRRLTGGDLVIFATELADCNPEEPDE